MRRSYRLRVPRHVGVGRHRPRLRIPRPRARLGVLLGVAALGAVAILAALVVQVQAVKADLEAVKASAGTMKVEVEAKDFAGLAKTISSVSANIANAQETSNAFLWRAAEMIPFAGDNLRAVRVVTEQSGALLDSLATPALAVLPPSGELPKTPKGNIDFTFVNSLGPLAEQAQIVLPKAKRELDAVQSPYLVPQISGALAALSGAIDKVEPIAEQAPAYLRVLRAFLGMDRPTTIALVAQNNAEAAALGGNSEHISILSIDKGNVSTLMQISQRDLPLESVPSPVGEDTLALHTGIMLTWANAATFRPDFPTTAALLTEHLSRTFGLVPDAFVSIDPLALSEILGATGPITLETGDVITSENAVSLLLNEAYLRYPEDQIAEKTDLFFNSAATEILTALKSGNFESGQMITALANSIDLGSFMLWFRDPALQQVINGQRIAGQLASSNAPNTEVGVYFRDNSASKIDYYLETSTHLTGEMCAPARQAVAEVTLHSLLTPELAQSLPSYVNSGAFGWEFFRTEVYVYAPIGAEFSSLEIVQSSKATDLVMTGKDLGRNVAKFSVDLRPGETAVVRATMSGAAAPAGRLQLRTTPMIHGASTVDEGNCG